MVLIGLVLLLIASFYDIKTKEVPLMLSASLFIVRISYLGLCHNELTLMNSVMSAIIIFLILIIGAVFFDLGGADCLVGGAIGFYLGVPGIYAVLFAFVLTLPLLAYQKCQGTYGSTYPFVPFLTMGYGLGIALMVVNNVAVNWIL